MSANTAKTKLALIHTSPAAIGPVMQFYTAAAPEFEITNFLEDGLLRLLAAKDIPTAEARLSGMITVARETYGAEVVMITCSSVPQEVAKRLGERFDIPILKIDYPMARQAVSRGRRIGVAATFPPTLVPTTKLIRDAAADAGVEVEIVEQVEPAAYEALLANDTARHDELLTALVESFNTMNVDAIVLAQVSMARVLPLPAGATEIPVLTSLHTSLDALREVNFRA